MAQEAIVRRDKQATHADLREVYSGQADQHLYDVTMLKL
tara:strand:+ start:180 stop:296 length:117 start_codon:yes stop_codon:yes gene_type:complete